MNQPRVRNVACAAGEAPDRLAQGPEGASLRPRIVHCLLDFDPASLALLPPASLPAGSTEICGLLTLAEAKRVVPEVAQMEPSVNSGLACRYRAGDKGGLNVITADEPRASYEDRRTDEGLGGGRYFLVGDTGSSRTRGAWVQTRVGPVEIHGGATSTRPGLDAGQISALAELLVPGR